MNKLYNYYVPKGGLPQQNQKVKDRAIFKNAYLFIPREVLCDIVTSQLPFWNKTRMWVLSRPTRGFSETFSHYIVEVKSGGGSDHTENDPTAESILFVVEGTLELNISNKSYKLSKGSYVFLPPSIKWTIFNLDNENACFNWIRKKYSFVEGINEQIMEEALSKAQKARLHILEVMNKAISEPKTLSENAPSLKKLTVNQDKIKEIIGKGGAVIKGIQQDSGASVDIDDNGVVTIFGQNQSQMQKALEIVESIIEEPEVNKIYEGKVVKIMDFGAFVNILPGKDGLLHISEISNERVENVTDVLSEGDTVKVKLLGFDRGKMKLSAKAVD